MWLCSAQLVSFFFHMHPFKAFATRQFCSKSLEIRFKTQIYEWAHKCIVWTKYFQTSLKIVTHYLSTLQQHEYHFILFYPLIYKGRKQIILVTLPFLLNGSGIDIYEKSSGVGMTINYNSCPLAI